MEMSKDKLADAPEFDELGTAGSNTQTISELQERGFFQNPEHPKDEDLGDKPFNGFKYPSHALEEELTNNNEIILEAIDHTKIDDVDVDELITAPLISLAQQPRGMGKTEEVLEEAQDNINLDEIFLEFT